MQSAKADCRLIQPNPGWAEQDAEEIWSQQYYTFKKVLSENKIKPEEIIGVGITNQRETIVAWDKTTGKPIYRAIVWQCRRTSKFIENLPNDILNKIKNKTTFKLPINSLIFEYSTLLI